MKVYLDVSGSHPLSNATRIIFDVTTTLKGDGGAVIATVPLMMIPGTETFVSPGSIPVKWDKLREVEFHVKASYMVVSYMPWESGTYVETETSDDGHGEYSIVLRSQATYGPDGIQFGPGALQTLQKVGRGEVAVQLGIGIEAMAPKADKTELRFLLSLAAGKTTQGFGLNVWIVSVAGPNGQVSVQKDMLATYLFDVTERPQQQPTPIILPTQLLNHVLIFERENQQHLSPEEVRRLQDGWVRPLHEKAPELAAAISQGICPIHLLGHASTPGGNRYNENLSSNRISSVAAALKSTFPEGEAIVFVFKPKGEAAAMQNGPVANERRVKIEIPKAVATMAIERLRSYSGMLGAFRRMRDRIQQSPGNAP